MVQRYAQEVKDAALRSVLKVRDPCESYVDIQTRGQFRQHCHCIVHVLGLEKKMMPVSHQNVICTFSFHSLICQLYPNKAGWGE